MNSVSIIKSQFANLYSVINALKALGAEAALTDNPEEILASQKIIFPGVGSFEQVKQELDQKNLTETIKKAAKSKKPFLGICLGMQLLFENSSEGEKPCQGLSLLKGQVLPLPPAQVLRIPHIGWNSLNFTQNHSITQNINNLAQVYFVHSYYCAPEDRAQIVAYAEVNGFKVPAIIKSENVYGMQFHPERSGQVGLKLLENFLKL